MAGAEGGRPSVGEPHVDSDCSRARLWKYRVQSCKVHRASREAGLSVSMLSAEAVRSPEGRARCREALVVDSCLSAALPQRIMVWTEPTLALPEGVCPHVGLVSWRLVLAAQTRLPTQGTASSLCH